MVYIDYKKYNENIQNIIVKLSEHRTNSEVETPYMTDAEKEEFQSNLKRLIDEDIPFEEKMVILREVCLYSREVDEFLFGKKK